MAVQIDADGQHDPRFLTALVERLDGADVVIGARFAKADDPYVVRGPRRWAMVLLAWVLSRLARTRLTDVTSGFRVSNRRAIALFAKHYPAEYLGDTVESLVIAARAGCRITQEPVTMRARTAGRASHSPVKAAIYLCRAVVALLLALVRDWPAQFEDEAEVRTSTAEPTTEPHHASRPSRSRRHDHERQHHPGDRGLRGHPPDAVRDDAPAPAAREVRADLGARGGGGHHRGAVPDPALQASEAVGLAVPTNLLFFCAAIVILVLTLQHSSELSRLEERTRTLAEELALVRLEIERDRESRRAAGVLPRRADELTARSLPRWRSSSPTGGIPTS